MIVSSFSKKNLTGIDKPLRGRNHEVKSENKGVKNGLAIYIV